MEVKVCFIITIRYQILLFTQKQIFFLFLLKFIFLLLPLIYHLCHGADLKGRRCEEFKTFLCFIYGISRLYLHTHTHTRFYIYTYVYVGDSCEGHILLASWGFAPHAYTLGTVNLISAFHMRHAYILSLN